MTSTNNSAASRQLSAYMKKGEMNNNYFPGISVILPVLDRRDVLCRCIRSLALQNYPRDQFELIIVDTRAGDGDSGIADMLDDVTAGLSIRHIRQTRNLGPAAARNIGASHAQHRILAFIECDTCAGPLWLRHGAAYFDQPTVGGVEGLLVCSENDQTPRTCRQLNPRGGAYNLANMFYRKEVFDHLGGFDPLYYEPQSGLSSGGDVEFAFRAIEAHWEIPFAPEMACTQAPGQVSWRQVSNLARSGYFDPLLKRQHPEVYSREASFTRWHGLTGRYARRQCYGLGAALFPSAAASAAAGWQWTAAGLAGAFAVSLVCTFLSHTKDRKRSVGGFFGSLPSCFAAPYIYMYNVIRGNIRFRGQPCARAALPGDEVMRIEEKSVDTQPLNEASMEETRTLEG